MWIFTKYKMYAWLNSQQPTSYYNDVIDNYAEPYVDHHFKDSGYTVDTLNPNILLGFILKIKKKVEVQTSNPYNYSNYTYHNYPYNQRYNNLYYNDGNYNYNRHYSYNLKYSIKTRKFTKMPSLLT